LIANKKLIGIIVLGSKVSGDAYTHEDLELLDTLSKQASVAIENARQYKQIQDFGKTLQGKVDEQTKDIAEKNAHLQELLAMKSDFLRVVNHQLNTPFSIMRGYFSMMKEGDYPPEKALPVIEAGLTRIINTVSAFWDAYKLEGEKMKMEPQKVDIKTIVEKMVEEKNRWKRLRKEI
jgi:signal transduction histidine kinase